MTLVDGDRITLMLRPGAHPEDGPVPEARRTFERSVTGVVRSFEQDGVIHWEVLLDDPQYPAIGFDPETATLTKLTS